jgi:predicted MFS family arabinose efflux permease
MKFAVFIFLLGLGIWAIQPYFIENPEMRLLGYLCILFMAIGYFAVWLAPDFYESVEADKKTISYILLILGIISLLPSSLWVFFITRKPEIGWQVYSSLMTIPIGFIFKESSKIPEPSSLIETVLLGKVLSRNLCSQ